MRDSPAAELGRRFVANGYTVQCYDPQARNGLEGTIRLPTALDAATGADVLVIATEWPEFVGVDLAAVAGVMRGKRVVDARNILDGDAARANGLAYAGIGRT